MSDGSEVGCPWTEKQKTRNCFVAVGLFTCSSFAASFAYSARSSLDDIVIVVRIESDLIELVVEKEGPVLFGVVEAMQV